MKLEKSLSLANVANVKEKAKQIKKKNHDLVGFFYLSIVFGRILR